ncbi:MAG TPA: hypothetical protein PK844_02300 [Candidatus Atribacteria bacterium]|nr:hypothetical protein [Candidatus Atribacteria bacterium]HQE25055.1 hypothetical protein [Candidatus Atribacteria bacterium]
MKKHNISLYQEASSYMLAKFVPLPRYNKSEYWSTSYANTHKAQNWNKEKE